jgi:hypothetical protein
MTSKLTPEQQAHLDGYRKGISDAFKTINGENEQISDNRNENVEHYLQGQRAAFNMLEEQYGLIEFGTAVDQMDEVGKTKYYEGYQDGISDNKRTILYTIMKASTENPALKPVQAALITELFKIIEPEKPDIYS